MTELVTGEAVVLELRLAKWPARALAASIDIAVQITLLILLSTVVVGLLSSVDAALAAAIVTVSSLLIFIGLPVTVETLSRGRSLGKLAVGLRVVREDGGPIRFRHAFVRALLGLVELWLSSGVIATLVSLFSTQGRRVGDFLAGTLVLRERVPVTAGAVAMMPPALAGWATGLDLSALPDDLALAARQYLSRMPDLAPEVRETMGRSMATAVAQVTTPAPPPGVPAWAFLAAVVAERRRRESLRLSGPMPMQMPVNPPPYAAPPLYATPPPVESPPGDRFAPPG